MTKGCLVLSVTTSVARCRGITSSGGGPRSGARIPGILMHRNVADGRIALDQRLSAVPMVYVPVHDQDAGLVELLRVPRSDDDVVDETESHRARREGVMSGRTGGGEGRARHDRPLHRP